ncbi:hypothetical protein KM043_010815, partial [Ampulex compressa]
NCARLGIRVLKSTVQFDVLFVLKRLVLGSRSETNVDQKDAPELCRRTFRSVGNSGTALAILISNRCQKRYGHICAVLLEMARVVIYERPVDAVLADAAFYEKPIRTIGGVRIKEEPPDSEAKVEESEEYTTTTKNGGSRKRRDTSLAEKQLSNSNLHNKENEYVPDVNPTDTDNGHGESKKVKGKSKRKAPRKSVIRGVARKQPKNAEESTRTRNPEAPVVKRKRNSSKPSKRSSKRIRRSVDDQPAVPVVLYNCGVCFLIFMSQKALLVHERSHERPRNFVCGVCQESFTRASRLITHKTLHDTLPNSLLVMCCDICGHRFYHKRPLQEHLFHSHADLLGPQENAPVDELELPECSIKEASPIDVETQKTDAAETSDTMELSITTIKKMRQPTITEFLQFSVKKQKIEPSTPEKPDTPSTHVPPDDQSTPTSSKQPFVKIHANSHLMMELLNSSENVKSEPLEESYPSYVHEFGTRVLRNKSLRTPQSGTGRDAVDSWRSTHPRRTTMSNIDYTSDGLDRTPKCGKENDSNQEKSSSKRFVAKKCARRIGATTSLPSSTSDDALNDELRARFGCKDCSVRLVRWHEEFHNVKTPKRRPSDIPVAKTEIPCDTDAAAQGSPSSIEMKMLEVSLVKMAKEGLDTEAKYSVPVFETKSFPCKVCKKVFASKENRREHTKLFHMIYMSSICQARCTTKRKLLNHYMRQHTLFKRRECCVCRQLFASRASLKRHMQIHCIKIVRSQSDHYPIDIEVQCNAFRKNHKCKACRKRFWLHSCLKQHEVVCREIRKIVKVEPQEQENDVALLASDLKDTKVATPEEANLSTAPEVADPNQKSSNPEKTVEQPVDQTSIVKQQNKAPPAEDLRALNPPVSSEIDKPQTLDAKAGTVANQLKLSSVRDKTKGFGSDRGKYPCIVCGKQFQTVKNWWQHKRVYNEQANDQCSICGTAFPTKRFLRIHINSAHMQPGSNSSAYKFHCRFCNQGFLKKGTVRMHELHFHAGQTMTMPPKAVLGNGQAWGTPNTICTICDLLFETYERFVQHNMYYYRGQVFTCTFCGQAFQGMYMLHHHNKLAHYPEETKKSYSFICVICNEGFNHESHYHAHQLHVHAQEAYSMQNGVAHRIEQEPKNVPVEDSADLVPVATQEAVNLYICHVCKLHFTTEKDLAQHVEEFSKDGDYQCNNCSKKYCTSAVLYKHICLNHAGCNVDNGYKCRTCGEVVTTSISLMCHEKHFHADEVEKPNAAKPVRVEQTDAPIQIGKVSCLTCGMTFEKELDLKTHLLEYSDIGDYSCSVCHRRFVELDRLENHQKKHTRLNFALSEYHCPICLEGFANDLNVTTHILHLHRYESFDNLFHKTFQASRASKDVNASPSAETQLDKEAVSSTESVDTPAELNDVVTSTCDESASPALDIPEPLNNSADTTSLVTPSESSACTPASPRPQISIKAPTKQLLLDHRNETITQCSICKMNFINTKILLKHKIRYLNMGKHMCELCGRRFPWPSLFNEHYMKHFHTAAEAAILKFSCPHCGERFQTQAFVDSHVIHVHGPPAPEDQEQAPTDKLVVQKFVVCEKKAKVVPNVEKVTSDNRELEGSMNAPMQTSTAVDDGKEVEIIDVSNDMDDVNIIAYKPAAANAPVRRVDVVKVTPGKEVAGPTQKRYTYTCPVCIVSSPSLKEFQAHYKLLHQNPLKKTKLISDINDGRIVECVICDSICMDELSFKRHLETTHMPRMPVIKASCTPISAIKFIECPMPSSSRNDNDVPEVLWEKKNPTVIETLTIDEDTRSVEQQPKLQPRVNEQSVSLNNAGLVANYENVNQDTNPVRLKVRPLAKIIENLSRDNLSSSNSVVSVAHTNTALTNGGKPRGVQYLTVADPRVRALLDYCLHGPNAGQNTISESNK